MGVFGLGHIGVGDVPGRAFGNGQVSRTVQANAAWIDCPGERADEVHHAGDALPARIGHAEDRCVGCGCLPGDARPRCSPRQLRRQRPTARDVVRRRWRCWPQLQVHGGRRRGSGGGTGAFSGRAFVLVVGPRARRACRLIDSGRDLRRTLNRRDGAGRNPAQAKRTGPRQRHVWPLRLGRSGSRQREQPKQMNDHRGGQRQRPRHAIAESTAAWIDRAEVLRLRHSVIPVLA